MSTALIIGRPTSRAAGRVSAALADVDAGMRKRHAAQKHGVNESSVYLALKVRGKPKCPMCGRIHLVARPRLISPLSIHAALADVDDGMNQRDAAKKHGVSGVSVCRALKARSEPKCLEYGRKMNTE